MLFSKSSQIIEQKTLGACPRNIWYFTDMYDIDMTYVHVIRKHNIIVDGLSKRKNSEVDQRLLFSQLQDPFWVVVSLELLEFDNE